MKRSTWWTIGGVAALIFGVLCLLNPFAGSIAVTLVTGWAFSLIGLLQIVAVILTPGIGNKVMLAILGILSSYLGWTILANPLEGVLTLTFAVGLLFLATGLVRLVVSFGFRDRAHFWALILSAAISIVLGGMILANFPRSAVNFLGVLLSVQLLFEGAWLLGLAAASRRVERAVGAN